MERIFVKAGDTIIPLCDIESVDIAGLESGSITVTYAGGKKAEAHDFDAFEIVMLLHPAAVDEQVPQE